MVVEIPFAAAGGFFFGEVERDGVDGRDARGGFGDVPLEDF